MSYFSYSFNMGYLYGGNIFGGCCRRTFFPAINPFMMGAMNGYNSSMGNFFLMSLFNPMFSQPSYSMPQMIYSQPSFNYKNMLSSYSLPAYNTEPSSTYDVSKYNESSSKWNEAYSKLMNSIRTHSQTTASSSLAAVSSSVSSVSTQSSSVVPMSSSSSMVSSSSVVQNNSAVNTKKLGRDLGPEFINKVKEIAKNINCDWQDLLGVMQAESGINPQQWNPGRTAVGLIQFTDLSVTELNQKCGLNLTKEKISQMSAIEQLDLVEKYLKIAKSYTFSPSAKLSSADLYAVVFLPGRANRDVLTRRGEGYYHSNPIDENRDGVISKADLAIRVAKKRLEVFG